MVFHFPTSVELTFWEDTCDPDVIVDPHREVDPHGTVGEGRDQ